MPTLLLDLRIYSLNKNGDRGEPIGHLLLDWIVISFICETCPSHSILFGPWCNQGICIYFWGFPMFLLLVRSLKLHHIECWLNFILIHQIDEVVCTLQVDFVFFRQVVGVISSDILKSSSTVILLIWQSDSVRFALDEFLVGLRIPRRFLPLYRLLFCFFVTQAFFEFGFGGHVQIRSGIGGYRYICWDI